MLAMALHHELQWLLVMVMCMAIRIQYASDDFIDASNHHRADGAA